MAENWGLSMASGCPVGDETVSVSVGYPGPLTLANGNLLEKLAHLNRERIPERRVFAESAAGAHGVFVVTHDVSDLCCADFLGPVGNETPVFVRFSSMTEGSIGLRGMAVRFCTRRGNWDLVCGSLPVFYIRDPILFPDLVHAMDRHPSTHLHDPTMVWDFWTMHPECLHAVAYSFARMGRPKDYRHMHAWCVHTLLWYNAGRDGAWVRLRLVSEEGFHSDEGANWNGDAAVRDLVQAIAMGRYPSWRLECSALPIQDTLPWDPFDATVIWPEEERWRPVGRISLLRNPANYFAEVEQAAFSPGNLVPGMAPSFDPLLQGAMMACPDAHRYRLGTNYGQIPINTPKISRPTALRDGAMAMGDNGGGIPAYFPSTLHGIVGESFDKPPIFVLQGAVMPHVRPLDERVFAGAGRFYRSLDDGDREDMCSQIAASLMQVTGGIRSRAAALMYLADASWGTSMVNLLHLDIHVVENLARMSQADRIAATSTHED